jgi:hypothetical protein
MVCEVGGLNWPTVSREIAWAGTNNSRQIGDLAGNKCGVIQTAHAQRNVQIFADDVDDSVGDHKIEGNLRAAHQKVGQHRYEMTDRNERQRVHAQMSARRKARRPNIGFRRLDGGKNLARAFKR